MSGGGEGKFLYVKVRGGTRAGEMDSLFGKGKGTISFGHMGTPPLEKVSGNITFPQLYWRVVKSNNNDTLSGSHDEICAQDFSTQM